MPLFFFISGYVAYKGGTHYSPRQIAVKLWDKFKVLIVPAIVMGLCYTYLVLGKTAYDFSFEVMKYGYWFTISLFVMNIIYVLLYWATQNKSKSDFIYILVAISIFLWCLKYMCLNNCVFVFLNKTICLWHTLTHFIFFALGIIISACSREYEQVMREKGVLNTLLILFFVIAFLIMPRVSALDVELPIGGVLRLVLGFCGSLIVLNLSLLHKSNMEHSVGRFFSFIGRRSLEIYLLHYFLLPDLTYAAEYVDTSSTIIGLSISLLISILIIALCLIIGNIIRLSPFLSSVLLGVKNK